MAATTLVREERVGLALAVAAHVALVALLVWRPLGKPVLPPPERMTVTISDEVGLTSTSPEPAAASAPDVAPDLGEPAPPEPEPAPPQPIAPPEPAPPPPQRPVAKPPPPRPAPRAKPAPTQRPSPARAQPKPQPKPQPRTQPAAQPSQTRAQPAERPPRISGASRIGDDFLKGTPAAQNIGTSRNPPAQAIGPAVRSSLAAAISRQLKPKWAAPQGADADKLVTILSWSLNRDGTLAGQPTVVRQDGITDSNRPQASRHAEQAIRAVQLAAPFELPPEYYDAWKRVASFRFDRKLSQ
jgi:outer membrane biosynthesis protein TonB